MESAQNNLLGADLHHKQSFYVGLSPKHNSDDIDRLIGIFSELDKLISD